MHISRFITIRSVSGWITTIALMVVILFSVSTVTYQRGLQELSAEGTIRLELFNTYLRGVLEKYESLPELLARDNKLVNLLHNPGDRARIEALNRYLQTINEISNASDTYLMDREGLTIAASNWQEERPFVGRNFSYRPYFQQAMQGELGRYFALGTASSKRGYYFAYPVRRNAEILGAVVLKVNIDSVEKRWGHHAETFLVTGPDGVVFITTNPHWRFKTFGDIEEKTLDLIKKSKRYPNSELQPLAIQEVKKYGFGSVINIRKPDGKPATYLQQIKHMEDAGWDVHILSSISPLRKKIVEVAFMIGSSIIFTYILLILLVQRRQRLTELKRFEDRARRALQEANEKLESRVTERTSELLQTNQKLLNEIQERRHTEAVLKRTRSELVHAAKMATLGQMSAGINHELNQPLAAIRSYSDNARQLLVQDRTSEAEWNLVQIGELTDRMAHLGAQLKEFSRKSSGALAKIPLHGVFDGAMEILTPVIRKAMVTVSVHIEPEHLEANGNLVLLQQVFVNLLSNAIQAMEMSDEKNIDIQAYQSGDRIKIVVQDSGSGISSEHLKNIFDPFFTTKKPGQGLGLGLTITERILKEMHGAISVDSSHDGTRFTIELMAAEPRYAEN